MAFTMSDQASTAGKVITCKAAIAYELNSPLSFEDIHVAPPGPTEVRIQDRNLLFPRILGHEGAGIVESVGSAITDLKPGDKVIPVWQAECQKCPRCRSGRSSNICDVFLEHFESGVMRSDRTSRFSRVADGKPIFHFCCTSVFSQYTVLDEACVAKINSSADLSKVCLLGCGVSTGIGSAWNIAKVTPNSSVAVFGLGTIGLAVVEGAKIAGASRIIGIDRLESKFEKGKDFGLTDTLNTSTIEKPIEAHIYEMTKGGVDFSFDCTGNPDIISAAMQCCRPDGGVAVIIGLVDSRKLVSFHPSSLLLGKSWTSGLFGGFKARTQLPGLVEKCMDGVINLDHYVTHTMPFSDINKAIQLLDAGECLRCIMDLTTASVP
ncbi:hypothetical protein KC19_6G086700 [Ceratodon purpureus]|uniref:Alcohol dehydrogenase n=1 Tax=Ceratodon purpureus TaxID=3225 RepID=A0A8T0HC74_CERPU|nr:hypothetical protein KC19_6G086700 [Ceratodon purpureus]